MDFINPTRCSFDVLSSPVSKLQPQKCSKFQTVEYLLFFPNFILKIYVNVDNYFSDGTRTSQNIDE